MEENNKEIIQLKKMKKKINEYILGEINRKYRSNEEKVLCELLNAMGYETRIVKKSDTEKDIVATKPNTSLNILLQFKENTFDQDEEDRDVFKIDNNYDVLVTLSNCGEIDNNYAKELKINKALGGKEIIELVLKYYNKMSDEFKTQVPLKSIFIPADWDIEDIKENTLFS